MIEIRTVLKKLISMMIVTKNRDTHYYPGCEEGCILLIDDINGRINDIYGRTGR